MEDQSAIKVIPVVDKDITCYERWDYEAFESIRLLDIRPVEVKNSLLNIKLHQNEDGRIMVRYSTKKGDPKGRLYGNLALRDEKRPTMYWPMGLSLQGLPKWVRHFVSHKYYRDFDISNCAPNLMEQILTQHHLCPPALIHYNKNRSLLFDRYSRQYNIPRDEVKTVFIGILHTGKADTRFKESVAIKQGLDSALRQLAKTSMYAPVYKSVAKEYNPLGAFCFMVWSREEHQVLMCMREFFIKRGYEAEHMVLCYDGLMLEKNELLDQVPLDMADLSHYIKQQTTYRLDIEEKSLLPTVDDLTLLESFSKK